MKAVVFYAPGDIRVEEVERPVCRAGEALVKVDACAVCGSDMKAARTGNVRIKPPRIMGHEFTGLIVQKGDRVDDIAPENYAVGDRIVMATSVSCGECLYCRRGQRNLCVNLAPMGYSFDGGMAEYVAIPEQAILNGHLLKTPNSLPAETAALAEPVSCAINSIEQCNVKQGDTVVIIGAGPMGILNACIARAYGASKIIFAELNPQRLKQCEQFRFDRLINPSEEDLKQVIMDETDGYGADTVIVAAPAAAPQEQALELVRKQGNVMLFASLPAGKSMLNIDSRLIHYKELRVLGSSDSTPEHVRKAVEILSSKSFPAEAIVTHRLPLDGIEQAFELMRSGESLRVTLIPGKAKLG
ncbi:MAG: alcohol dehydrogenase catalytic domain-containing protein [Prevotellaceae bacterium]|jgi:L-iditol 2-dehydrogenase|nr:alcohol dehydrogenase catalytic domain-containing protein [Prevotellaceae bacterium]